MVDFHDILRSENTKFYLVLNILLAKDMRRETTFRLVFFPFALNLSREQVTYFLLPA